MIESLSFKWISNGASSSKMAIMNYILFWLFLSFSLWLKLKDIPYRRDIYKPLNRASSRIVRVAAANGLAQDFRTVFPAEIQIKNSTSIARSILVYVYGMKIPWCPRMFKITLSFLRRPNAMCHPEK